MAKLILGPSEYLEYRLTGRLPVGCTVQMDAAEDQKPVVQKDKVLTTKKRNRLRKFVFPKQRKLPLPDKTHCTAALSRANQTKIPGMTQAEVVSRTQNVVSRTPACKGLKVGGK